MTVRRKRAGRLATNANIDATKALVPPGLAQAYLVLHYDANRNCHWVELLSDLDDTLLHWGSSTRLSPVYIPRDSESHKHPNLAFKGRRYLAFVALQHPVLFSETFERAPETWFTLGIFNLALYFRDAHLLCTPIGRGILGSVL